jgi:hypothetical protein
MAKPSRTAREARDRWDSQDTRWTLTGFAGGTKATTDGTDDGGGGEALGPPLLLSFFPSDVALQGRAALGRVHTWFEDEENKRTRPGILGLLFTVL